MGDPNKARDGLVGQLMTTLLALNNLKGSAYEEQFINTVKRRADLRNLINKLNNNESLSEKETDTLLEIVKEYKEDSPANSIEQKEKNISGEDMEILDTVVSNAEQFLEYYNNIEKYEAEVNRLFKERNYGIVDQDLKEEMVFERALIDYYKEQKDSLGNQIDKLKKALSSEDSEAAEGPALTEEEKTVIALNGNNSIKNSSDLITKQEDALTKLDERINALSEAIETNNNAIISYRKAIKKKSDDEQSNIKKHLFLNMERVYRNYMTIITNFFRDYKILKA